MSEAERIARKIKDGHAVASAVPGFSGDGYGYGGGAVLTIGDRSFMFGEGYEAHKLAE